MAYYNKLMTYYNKLFRLKILKTANLNIITFSTKPLPGQRAKSAPSPSLSELNYSRQLADDK